MRKHRLLLLFLLAVTMCPVVYGQQQSACNIPSDKKEIIDRFIAGIAEMTRQIIAEGPRGHIMIGADCSVPSPLDITANIHAAVSTAHGR